jgi:hypothetical protein
LQTSVLSHRPRAARCGPCSPILCARIAHKPGAARTAVVQRSGRPARGLALESCPIASPARRAGGAARRTASPCGSRATRSLTYGGSLAGHGWRAPEWRGLGRDLLEGMDPSQEFRAAARPAGWHRRRRWTPPGAAPRQRLCAARRWSCERYRIQRAACSSQVGGSPGNGWRSGDRKPSMITAS